MWQSCHWCTEARLETVRDSVMKSITDVTMGHDLTGQGTRPSDEPSENSHGWENDIRAINQEFLHGALQPQLKRELQHPARIWNRLAPFDAFCNAKHRGCVLLQRAYS